MYNHVKPCVLLRLRLTPGHTRLLVELSNYLKVVDLVVVCMYVCMCANNTQKLSQSTHRAVSHNSGIPDRFSDHLPKDRQGLQLVSSTETRFLLEYRTQDMLSFEPPIASSITALTANPCKIARHTTSPSLGETGPETGPAYLNPFNVNQSLLLRIWNRGRSFRTS